MTLTTRLLTFLLGSTAAVLVGFSAALYLLAQAYLYRQADERLDAALSTLGAAVEVGPDGVEWEPGERALRLPSAADGVAWVVTDDGGQVVARSDGADSDELLAEAAGRLRETADGSRRMHWRGERWQAGRRRFEPDPARADSQPPDPKDVKYLALEVTAALPLDPTRAVLRQLLVALVGISSGVLVVTLGAGWFVCRRALRPVRRMADDARAMPPADPTRRLAVPGGGDELTDLGAAFNGLLDRLHETADRHRRFAGDASHQLRTPLTALLGQLEIALRRERPAGDYRDALTAAHAQAAHLHKIIDALLLLTRAGADAGARRERFDLTDWLRGHLDSWATHPRHADLRLTAPDAPVPVDSQPVLLGEAVNVLIDNATRYSPAGTEISLTLSHADGAARIAVADHGPGIAAADLPQVFTPFFRTTDALVANRHGVGLGLSIARRLAEALGGTLAVASRVGAGSVFTVTLPTAAGHPPPAAPAAAG